MKEIQVQYKLDEDQMKCPICYNTITTPLLQCLNAPHFVCLTCVKKSRRKAICPLCRTARLYHNKFLEKTVKDQMIACPNVGCPRILFTWDVEHVEECPYKPMDCQFCDEKVSKATMKEHYTSCSIPWINEHDVKDGSEVLVCCSKKGRRGIEIELDSIKTSFVVIRSEQLLIFKRNTVEFEVIVINLGENTTATDLTYWLPSESETYEKYNTISISKVDDSSRPKIPIEAIDIQIDKSKESDSEETSPDGIDRFFQQLLDTRREEYD